MTLEQVANLTGMTRQQLAVIETSKGYPHIPTLIRIAKAIRCPLRDILNGPLQLDIQPAPVKGTDYPCANAEKCMFYKRKH